MISVSHCKITVLLETFGFGVSIDTFILVSAAHSLGIGNCEADEESRTEDGDTKLFLNADYFKAIREVYSSLAMDFLNQGPITNWKKCFKKI